MSGVKYAVFWDCLTPEVRCAGAKRRQGVALHLAIYVCESSPAVFANRALHLFAVRFEWPCKSDQWWPIFFNIYTDSFLS